MLAGTMVFSCLGGSLPFPALTFKICCTESVKIEFQTSKFVDGDVSLGVLVREEMDRNLSQEHSEYQMCGNLG